jgi:hypothetical protein
MPLTARTDSTLRDFSTYNPGVARDSSGDVYSNGNRFYDQNYSIDGIVQMANPSSVGNGSYLDPGLESVGEMTFLTSETNAEYRTPTNFIIATKSGSNEWHGSAFYLYSGDALRARGFFSSTIPFNVTNDFAGSVGGPIKKNKLFFWADWEGLFALGQSSLNLNLPTALWQQGNFSSLLPTTQLKNPYTGAAIPGNILSNAGLSINTVSAALQNYLFPLPNYGPATLTAGNYRFLLPVRSHYPFDPLDIRVDYNAGTKDSVFGRWTFRHLPVQGTETAVPVAATFDQDIYANTAVLSWTHSFKSNLVNEFRTGYDRINKASTAPGQNGDQVNSQVGLQGVPPVTGFTGLSQISISSITTDTNEYANNFVTDTTINFIDNLSWTRGSHLMKFGMYALRDRQDSVFYSNSMFGSLTFNGVYTGFAYADYLLGLPQSTGYHTPHFRPIDRGTTYAMYAQDDWKVTRRLTVNYGIRYELPVPYSEELGRMASFDPSTGQLVAPAAGLTHFSPLFAGTPTVVSTSAAGYPANLVQFNKTSIYPRLGLAYKLTSDGNTVIRAGFGIYGNTIYPALQWAMSGNGSPPFVASVSYTNSTASQLIAAGTPLFSFPDPFPPPASYLSPSLGVSGTNPKIKTPYTEQWNLSLERQIGTYGFSASYVGLTSVKLLYPRNLDQAQPSTNAFSYSEQPYPSVTSITWSENGASQSMNELELAVRKTAGRNLLINAGYTWDRDLTNQSASGGGEGYGGTTIQNNYNRAAEWGNNSFEPLHRFFAMVEYKLPAGRDQRFFNNLPKVANGFLGDWRVSFLGTLNSGTWFTPSFSGSDPSHTNNVGGRPDVIPGVSTIPAAGRTITQWFNPAAFKVPGCPDSTPFCTSPADIGRFGDAAINTLEGPALRNLDMSLYKDIKIRENKTLEVQCIATDVFNHPNFGMPAATINSTTAGAITSTSTQNYLTGSSGTNRSVSLALRFMF